MHIILVSFPIGKFVSVQVCIWIIPLLVCNWKSVEELTVLLVGNIACILGIPPTLRLLFCLPISNASLKDQKKKKKKLLPTLPFFPSKIIVSYSLCFLPFCSSLFFISQSLQHGYQFAFYFLCANPQSFFFLICRLCSSDVLFTYYLGNSIQASQS